VLISTRSNYKDLCIEPPRHWPVPRWVDPRRNVIERGFNVIKQWRGLATRYDKLAIVYRAAAAVLRAITIWLTHLSDTQ
jgi:transposase